MPVLGAGLAREEDELLRTDALRVHVHDELEADLVELRETEVGDLDIGSFVRSQDDSGFDKNRRSTVPRCTQLLPRKHG